MGKEEALLGKTVAIIALVCLGKEEEGMTKLKTEVNLEMVQATVMSAVAATLPLLLLLQGLECLNCPSKSKMKMICQVLRSLRSPYSYRLCSSSPYFS